MSTADLLRTKYRDAFSARSVVGALGVLTVLCFFGFGLRAIDDAVRDASGFAVGQPFAVTPTTSFTPASDWVFDSNQSVKDLAVVAHRNGWELKIAGGLVLQPGQTIEDYAASIRSESSDPSTQLGDLETVVTMSGEHGVTWESHGATDSSVVYLIVKDDDLVQLVADGSTDTLNSVEDDLRDMAESITMSGGA